MTSPHTFTQRGAKRRTSGSDIVAVHRLTSFGALVTHVATGTTEQGFEGEWREITLSVVENDRISRSEMFDETDLDAALARFDELLEARQATREHSEPSGGALPGTIAARDWDALAEMLADDVSIDDRRRFVVNAGLWRGRDAVLEDLRVGAEIGSHDIMSDAHRFSWPAPHAASYPLFWVASNGPRPG